MTISSLDGTVAYLALQLAIYKHALLLFKLYNSIKTTSDWVRLNFQQILTIAK
jgi:hypothetical protein